MSAEQTRKTLEQFDKDISTLSKKSADFGKKEADARSKAARVSIPRSASAATIRTKTSQIARYESDANKAAVAKADVDKKLADKQKKRGVAFAKLQKEESAERKKDSKAQATLQRAYEQQIEALTERMNSQARASLTNPAISVGDELDEYDVFVSHAWEDKESFVEEFVAELTSLGLSVWYDQSQIKWGDSMREKIERGLSKSRFGVVVISPNYIAEGKYWTKAELDGLFQLESVNGKKILPIWHDITKKEVIAYSSIIAGRLAMNTASMTPKEIADKLVELLPPVETNAVIEKPEEDTPNE